MPNDDETMPKEYRENPAEPTYDPTLPPDQQRVPVIVQDDGGVLDTTTMVLHYPDGVKIAPAFRDSFHASIYDLNTAVAAMGARMRREELEKIAIATARALTPLIVFLPGGPLVQSIVAGVIKIVLDAGSKKADQ